MKRKAIRQLATTLKEQQRFPLYSRELTGWPNWQRLTREKSVKMLLNWQKYAPETDQLEAKDRETSVTGDKTGIGSIKKGSSRQKNGATARSLQQERVRTLILSCLTLRNWTAGETQSDQFIPCIHHLTAASESRVPPSPCHSAIELYKA